MINKVKEMVKRGEYIIICLVAPNLWSCANRAPYIGYFLVYKDGFFIIYYTEDTEKGFKDLYEKGKLTEILKSEYLSVALQHLDAFREELSEKYDCLFEIRWFLMPYDCQYWEKVYKPEDTGYEYGVGRIGENWFIWRRYCFMREMCEPLEIIEASVSVEDIKEKLKELERFL